MKHPLTSKERRGLAAVAAAALLCIGAGVIVRGCRGGVDAPAAQVSDKEALLSGTEREHDANAEKKKKKKNGMKSGRKQKRTAKKKAPKTYPTRDPLSEPCDE